MKNLKWRQWLVGLAFVTVVLATGLFAVRTVRRAAYWRSHRDETIRPWMNLGYIAHSHRVPSAVLHQALGLPLKPDHRPIRQIAREQGRPIEQVIAILQDAIDLERSQHGLPSESPTFQREQPPAKTPWNEPPPTSSPARARRATSAPARGRTL